MSRTLEELFNLTPEPSLLESAAAASLVTQAEYDTNNGIMQYEMDQVNAAIDKIDIALPTVHDLTTSDSELDEIASLAKVSFQTLMDLGMAVDSRVSGTIFQTASTLLGHALTAKQAKLDKKLKIIELQLKKAAHDLKVSQVEKKLETTQIEAIDGSGTGALLDRNAIIDAIIKKNVDAANGK